MTLPQEYLDQFDEAPGYLDHASIGPVSRHVREEVRRSMDVVAAGDGRIIEKAIGMYEAARETATRLVGGTAQDITFVPATSDGLFQVAFGLEGGNVVLSRHEFPANTYPWMRAASRGGPEVRFVDIPDQRVTADALRDAVDADTRAVVVSFVHYANGHRPRLEPLRELAGNGLLVVDAIQGLGAFPLTLEECDVIVAGGQKWLRSGWGSGILAVSPRARERLRSDLTGWYGVEDFLVFDGRWHEPRPDAEQYQEGSPPIFGGVAVGAAVEVIEMAGIATIQAAVSSCVREIEELVRARGGEIMSPWENDDERAGILHWRLAGEAAAVTVERLRAAGVVCVERTAGWVRTAPHATTGSATLALVAEAL